VLKADANSLLQILEMEGYELSIMLVSDRAIRKLNRDFRGKDQATDVLSFPQLDEDVEPAAIAHTDATDEPAERRGKNSHAADSWTVASDGLRS